MLENIGNLAERLATNVSESRRGFLARVGQGALGVAGVCGGLLALPAKAQAGSRTGICALNAAPGGLWYYTGICVSPTTCAYGLSAQCHGGGVSRPSYSGCRTFANRAAPCTF